MAADSDFQKAIELIDRSSCVLITTHARVDGDACGSSMAIAKALEALGKKTQVLFISELPDWYQFLFDKKELVLDEDITIEQLRANQLGEFDLVIIADTNSNAQIGKFGEYLKTNRAEVLVIDHHNSGDNLGTVEVLDSTAAATGLIVMDLFKYAGWQITPKIAEYLFVAIATDTGWFHFNNTNSRVYAACAELCQAGANPSRIYHSVYQTWKPSRFNLMLAMLNSLELHLDGRVAIQCLTKKDFEQSGATYKDTESLIDECQRISSVEVAAILIEAPDGRIRCSLRSRNGVDVCKIAQAHGGGGHKAAAGVHLEVPIAEAKQEILSLITGQMP